MQWHERMHSLEFFNFYQSYKMNEIEITSSRIRLRLIKFSDVESIYNLHSLQETDQYNTLGIPKDVEETKSIIEPWIIENKFQEIRNYTFAIETKIDRNFIGLFGLKRSIKKYNSAEVWYLIHLNHWEKGYATESLKAVLNYGFETLKLHRISAGCAVENIGSIKVLEKAGMQKEGIGRGILPLKSGWSNNFQYSILETDTRENNKTFKENAQPYNCYQINAFTEDSFGGNPACVVPLKHWIPDTVLLDIAKENAVPETAFFVDRGDYIHLRWFTPDIEMDLCGHATLATAHCLKKHLNVNKEQIIFKTLSGDLIVSMQEGMYHLDLPSRMPVTAKLPDSIKNSLNIQPQEIYKARDYVLVFDTEKDIQSLKINRQIFDQINLNPGGVIVTSKGDTADFVSRFFTPQATILEDPVTGSAHCSLIPFWAKRLGKKELHAIQISERRGELFCQNKEDRVVISGKAKTYAVGTIWIN